MYEVNFKACSLFVGLLSTSKFMRLYMYIVLVGFVWDYE